MVKILFGSLLLGNPGQQIAHIPRPQLRFQRLNREIWAQMDSSEK